MVDTCRDVELYSSTQRVTLMPILTGVAMRGRACRSGAHQGPRAAREE
jgi:hypothetical protein